MKLTIIAVQSKPRSILIRSIAFTTAALAAIGLSSGCGVKSGITVGGDPGTGADSLGNFKVTSFQGNTSSTWKTVTAAVWKTNLSTVTIAGTCARGIASIKVNQRLSGSGAPLVDAGVTASCVNNTYTWTKSFVADTNYVATAAGSGVQLDFNIYALDGVGNQVTDSTALTAIRFNKLAASTLTNIKYMKNYIQQTVAVSASTTIISDNPDPDTGTAGHCASSEAAFVFTGTQDPEASISITGATATNASSGSTLSYTACVPFGNTSLVLGTKDESGSSVGTQYAVNVSSSAVIQTFGSADEGFKFQGLAPVLSGLISMGINLINISADAFGIATTNSTGAVGYTLATGLTSYVQEVSP